MYFLIYVERPRYPDCSTQVRPQFFASPAAALAELIRYVATCLVEHDAIHDVCRALPASMAGLGISPNTPAEDFEARLSQAGGDVAREICDFYFAMMNDASVEAFYQIEAVEAPAPAPTDAMALIADTLSGKEWSPDMLDDIASIVRCAGFVIDEVAA